MKRSISQTVFSILARNPEARADLNHAHELYLLETRQENLTPKQQATITRTWYIHKQKFAVK